MNKQKSFIFKNRKKCYDESNYLKNQVVRVVI